MIPIVSSSENQIRARTTLIEKLVAELTRRGWRVCDNQAQPPRLQRLITRGRTAGATKMSEPWQRFLASPARIAIIEDAPRDYSLAETAERYIQDADIILAEGYKINPHPKIEVFRTELRHGRLCGPADNLIAVAGDRRFRRRFPFMTGTTYVVSPT